MGRYFRILEKAKLDKELFGTDSAPVEVTAFPPLVAPETAAPPVPVETPEPSATEDSLPAVETETAVAVAGLEEDRPAEIVKDDWRLELGQMLGLDSIPPGARLGLCPLGRMRSAVESAVAIGQWIAARASSPVLIVEASFDAPHLARLFRTRRLGLAEAMAASEPRWDHFVHDTLYANLKVLPAGRNPGLRRFLRKQDAFCRTLTDLSGSFENIIVVLPNPRVNGFDRLAISRAANVVFPVFEPGRVTASQASRAMRKLAAGSARVAAALVAPKNVVGKAAHMQHIAKRLGHAARGDHA